MYSRWFSTVVVLLWLSTMGWLVKEKVLPQLLLGDPPSHRSILEARRGEPAVSWQLLCNHRNVGWAKSATARLPDGGTRIDNHVHFDDLPVDQFAPSWLRGIFNMVDGESKSRQGKSHLGKSHSGITTDVAGALTIDGSNRLSRIDSTISFSPSGQEISMRGIVKDGKLKLNVRSLDILFKTQIPIDDDALLCDALSPTACLPGLYEGQTWTISVLTPLKYPNRPYGILQAKVEGFERINWNGRSTGAWLVVYRDNPGKSLSTDTRPRGKLWVRRDGVVLKQEMSILNSSITFVRLAADEPLALKRTKKCPF